MWPETHCLRSLDNPLLFVSRCIPRQYFKAADSPCSWSLMLLPAALWPAKEIISISITNKTQNSTPQCFQKSVPCVDLVIMNITSPQTWNSGRKTWGYSWRLTVAYGTPPLLLSSTLQSMQSNRSLWRQHRQGPQKSLCSSFIFSPPLWMTGKGPVIPSRHWRRLIMFIVSPVSISAMGQQILQCYVLWITS